MKLEVGKKYKTKLDDIVWYRVDHIDPDVDKYYSVVGTCLIKCSGILQRFHCSSEGEFCYLDKCLTEEYTEPEIQITEADVGRKVRLRNGGVYLVTALQGAFCCISRFDYWASLDGKCYNDPNLDIVELL